MRTLMQAVTLTVAFVLTTPAMSQEYEVDPELAAACLSDMDMTDYIIEVIQSVDAVDSDYVSAEEMDQIQTVLRDETNDEQSVSEKLDTVMRACAEGRIFQKRSSATIN